MPLETILFTENGKESMVFEVSGSSISKLKKNVKINLMRYNVKTN